MNILLAVDESNVPYSAVMLASFFHHNPGEHEFFLLYDKLPDNAAGWLKDFIAAHGGRSHFFFAGHGVWPDFMGSVSAKYFPLAAPFFLPAHLDRVLYISSKYKPAFPAVPQ